MKRITAIGNDILAVFFIIFGITVVAVVEASNLVISKVKESKFANNEKIKKFTNWIKTMATIKIPQYVKKELMGIREDILNYEDFSDKAQIVKRVYKPAYVEETLILGREKVHEEEHYIYIQYEGRMYKIKGKQIFEEVGDGSTVIISGARGFNSKGKIKHAQIEKINSVAA